MLFFLWIRAIRGPANILWLSPVSNKYERYPADQAIRQPAALARRRISTPRSPSLTSPLILTEPLSFCVQVIDTACCALLHCLNMVLDEIGSTGQGLEHVCKLSLQSCHIGELGGREVICPWGQSE